MISMSSKWTLVFCAAAILEAIIIVALVLSRTHFVMTETTSPITVIESPIALAVRYDAPDKTFEEVVKSHRMWLEYSPLGAKSFTILAECAYERRTNYVRILIDNGADVATALKELQPLDPRAKEAIALLEHVQSERNVDKPRTATNVP